MPRWPSVLAAALGLAGLMSCRPSAPSVEFRDDPAQGRLEAIIGGRPAFVYNYGDDWDLPHYWPLRSPEGRNMLVEKTEPYPHHRSFWFADTVRRPGGRDVSFYNAFYTGVPAGENDFKAPFRDRIRHLRFTKIKGGAGEGETVSELAWEAEGGDVMLRETRRLSLRALGNGEYFLDLRFDLRAEGGPVEFASDEVHYAWPYLRLETPWSGEGGGTLVTDDGRKGQEDTNLKPARWIDYYNTCEGETAGLAFFQYPDGREHRWLTREYGCFGPRRPDEQSGKPFTLQPGETLSQRIGVFVHRGDTVAGKVAERYRLYAGDTREEKKSPPMTFVEDSTAGTLTVRDGEKDVLTYRFGDRIKAGVPEAYVRSSYIHPLYGLDGQVLTEDSPPDHFHHHGLFWAWPVVNVRGLTTSNWEPGRPPLRQMFVRWAGKSLSPEAAELEAENAWILDGKEKVAGENISLRVHRAKDGRREIEIGIVLEAVGGPLELAGAPDQNKGYGGLCFRGAPLFTGAAILTDKGPLTGDVVNTPFAWAELAAPGATFRIDVAPGHPGTTIPWLIRNSYGGILNPSWPGLQPVTLNPGEPVRLNYRITIGR